jgi:hypothetical protein
MDTERNKTFSDRSERDPAITAIIRGEDVLAEARAVARKITGRVN